MRHSLRNNSLSALLMFIAVVHVTLPTAHSEEIKAGVAVIDITPPQGFRMSGYFYERVNTGTKDPLLAKAIVFQQGDTKAALVMCDLIGMTLEVTQRARKQAAEKTGIPPENIAITATHSHTGPLYAGALRDYFHQRALVDGQDPREKVDYTDVLTEKLVQVIASAREEVQPVHIQAGIGEETRISFNRRFHMKDGTVQFNPGILNPDIVRVAGPIDADVGLLRIRGAKSDEDLAFVTVFALHLDTVGGTEYSADYPYHLEVALRKKFGPDLVSLFAAGTCGDINHIDVTTKERHTAEQIGTMLAESVAKAAADLTPIDPPSLAVRSETVHFAKQRYSAAEVAKAREQMAKVGTRNLGFLDSVETVKIVDLAATEGDTLPIEVQVFRLSPDVAIVTLPGEVFVELGLSIKRASPFATTMVIELANSTPAYIPTRKAFAEGSYETLNSRVQPGGGEAMVEAAIRLLKELGQEEAASR